MCSTIDVSNLSVSFFEKKERDRLRETGAQQLSFDDSRNIKVGLDLGDTLMPFTNEGEGMAFTECNVESRQELRSRWLLGATMSHCP